MPDFRSYNFYFCRLVSGSLRCHNKFHNNCTEPSTLHKEKPHVNVCVQSYSHGTRVRCWWKKHMAAIQTFHTKVKFNRGDKECQSQDSRGASKQLNPNTNFNRTKTEEGWSDVLKTNSPLSINFSPVINGWIKKPHSTCSNSIISRFICFDHILVRPLLRCAQASTTSDW